MAEENIAFGIDIKTGKAVQSFATVKAELKALEKALTSEKLQGEAFTNAAIRAGQLRDSIADTRDTIAAFHPERKFQAFTQGIQGVVGGFTAVQGAMALFGNESEDLQKTLLKVQGAMALSQGLNSLMGMGDAFKNLGLVAAAAFNTIKTQAVLAFSTMKAAMISTGIGALIVALGLLINEVIDYNNSIDETLDKEKKLNEEREKTNELIKKEVERTDKLRNAKAGNLDQLIRELKLLEASGASAEKIYLKKKAILEKELYNLRVAQASGLAVQKEGFDKLNELEVLKAAREKAIADKKVSDAAEKASIKRKEGVELKQEEKAEQKDELTGIKAHTEKVNAALKDRDKKRIEDLKVAEKTKVEINLQAANALAGIGTLINQLAGESKELMAAGIIAENAAGIAKIIISTNASNAAMQTSPANISSAGIFGLSYATANWISAGIAIASSVAATSKALSALGSGGSAGGGGGNTSAPPPMTRPQSSRVSLDSGGKPISVSDKSRQRVYVVERDITNTQSRVSVIQNRAKFG